MLNTIITILVIPFMPFFMYGGLASNIKQDVKNESQVLGEQIERKIENDFSQNETNQDIQKYNLFPLDNIVSSIFTPIRKSDYADVKIFAGSSVAIDVDSGTILHYAEGRKQTQIASLTKLMTATLVMENVKNLDEEILITKEMLNVPGTVVGCPTSVFCNSNRMYVGEKISVRSLLKAMLLNSANDAATALGIHTAGSFDEFVKMMNDKAKSLGLKDTNFCTPSGLEIDGEESKCYSSAYDIARIASYSLKYELIWDIMRIPEDQIYSSDGTFMHQLKNTDILLSEIPNCLGGKTGFTPLAGKSLLLVTTDETKKHKIITVLLNDDNRWENMKKLVSWVFDNYEWR